VANLGDIVAGYRLDRKLGASGQGTVFLATDQDGYQYALKIPHGADPRFRSELNAALEVNSSYVAKVWDFNLETDPPFIAYAVVPGEPLNNVLVHRSLDVQSLAAIFRDVAAGLKDIHAVSNAQFPQLCHGDVTLDNIVVTPRNHAILIDLGAARTGQNSNQSREMFGKFGYFAPEQIRNQDTGPPTDVWQFGVALAKAACEHSPFGHGPGSVKKTLEDPPNLAGLPHEFREVVLGCLNKRAAQRPTAADLAAALERIARPAGIGSKSKLFMFADLFAGIGGFHAALAHAGGRCVYVSEIDEAARMTYARNWIDPLPFGSHPQVNTDITLATPADGKVDVPEHDVLTAGFPCQPFSKSGFQRGMEETRGTLFWNIARILEDRTPSVVLLENVRNLTGPRHRHEWDVIIQTLREIGYRVSSTPSVFSPHLLPPSMGGTPQVRDRVFILGTFVGPARAMADIDVAPTVVRGRVGGWDPQDWDVDWILDDDSDIENLDHYKLNFQATQWVNVWDDLVQRMWSGRGARLPGFPLWADAWIPERGLDPLELEALPRWKAGFLVKNARFYDDHRDIIRSWRKANPSFATFPESRRKLEWQAHDAGSLWDTVMHFRPSGIRAKAPTYLPPVVAITQTSIVGRRGRRLTPHESARLQGLPRSFQFANNGDAAAYKQVGNGVAVGAAWYVLREHVKQNESDLPKRVTKAILNADPNPCPDALWPAAYAFENQIQENRQGL
jgi:DNA (cytosine-5)-methyltransferase 1